MIGGTDVLFNIGFFANELSYLGGKPRISVRNDLAGDSIMWEHLLEIEFCQFFSPHCFLTGIT